MAVFVLGAGATRGASFVDAKKNSCLPPLDADFFTQIQRIKNPKHQQLVSQVIEDTVELYGPNFRTTLEIVFATFEHTIRMMKATGQGTSYNDLVKKRDRLLQAIAAIFEESLTVPVGSTSTLKMEECEHHEALIKMLRPGEHILTFNYDCVLDHSLRKWGDNKWNARYGYGFRLQGKGASLQGHGNWQPSQPATKERTIKVYKLHGSLHFQAESDRVTLKKRPYTKQYGDLKFTIIPPESHKRYEDGVFKHTWTEARTALRQNAILVLIGYSFPPTDLHSIALFRVSVKAGSLRSLVVVNPDKEARYRAREVLRQGLTPKTKVLTFEKFEEFIKVDRSLWS